MSNRQDRAPTDDLDDVLHSIDRVRARGGLRSIPADAPRKPTDETIKRDRLAQEEMRHFDLGDLETQARRTKHARGESAKGAFHRLKLYTLWVGWVMFAVMNVVWLLHVAAPSFARWLSPGEVMVIQNVIVALWAGKIGIFLERYANKHSDEDRE